MNIEVGISIGGRYQVIELLGQGGMAMVYKAYDTRLERTVALKVIRTDAIPANQHTNILRRFEREAKAVALLDHLHIVKVYDYGEHEGAPYLVMQYLPGGTLKERTGKRVPYTEAACLLLPVARALDYAHRRGIIHRDVKPANILVNEEGEVMLSDFGIARILEHAETTQLTSTGTGIGTPEYMPPEQWTGKPVQQTDIYALGVVFYELVTGHKPFTADTPAAVLIKHLNDPLPRPLKFVPDLPEEVEQVLFKALAKQPEERYTSMAELAKVLERLIALKVQGDGASGIQWDTEEQRAAKIQPGAAKIVASPVQRESRRWGMFWLLGGVGLMMAAVVVVTGLILLVNGVHKNSEMRTQTAAANVKANTDTAAAYPDSTEPPPAPGPVATMTSEKDGMVLVFVPEGEFLMGMSEEEIDAVLAANSAWTREMFSNAMPQHTVYLDDYWIDRTEVTNAMYAECVEGGGCTTPLYESSPTHTSYYGNQNFANYPVILVNWHQAATYCAWAGRRLPTEAEWEKAARGADGRSYPWGEGFDCTLANIAFYQDGEFQYCVEDTVAVGSYPQGASPYGALDMAGNVDEWVADWYAGDYYGISPSHNPQGPDTGEERVLRSGSWDMIAEGARTDVRTSYNPDFTFRFGFRCAASQPANNTDTGSPVESSSTEVSPGDGFLQDTGVKIINLADSGGNRYIRINVVLEFDPGGRTAEQFKEEIATKQPGIDDAIVKTVSSHTYDDLYTVEGKEVLKQELISAIEQQVPEYQVIAVYFTEFVMD